MGADRKTDLRWAVLGLGALIIDGLLLTLHRLYIVALRFGPVDTWPLSLDAAPAWGGTGDRSLVELWGQLQLLLAAVLLIRLAVRAPGRRILLVWGFVLIAVAADDRFRFHERAGALLDLEEVMPTLSAVGAQELGGLVYWALAAIFLGAALAVSYRDSNPATRRAARILLGTMAPLTFAAVAYVAFSATGAEVLGGLAGVAVVEIRVTVKLLTATVYLFLAMLWSDHPPDSRPGPSRRPKGTTPFPGMLFG